MKKKKELHIFGGHETHAHGRSSQINSLYFLHLKQKRVLVECLGSSGWFDLKRSTFSGTKESKVQNYLIYCKFEVLRATVALLSDIRPLWLKTDDVKEANKRQVVIFDRVEIGSIWQAWSWDCLDCVEAVGGSTASGLSFQLLLGRHWLDLGLTSNSRGAGNNIGRHMSDTLKWKADHTCLMFINNNKFVTSKWRLS